MEMTIRKFENAMGFFRGGKVRFIVETTNGAMVKTFRTLRSAKEFVRTHIAMSLGVIRKAELK